MSVVAVIFGVPMMIAAVLISPTGLHNLIHSAVLCVALGLLLPFAGWPIFLTVFALPLSGTGPVAAVLRLWLAGTVMATAVINLIIAVMDYSPARPGLNPTAGFLLAGFVVCMLVACGVWGGFAAILPPHIAISGALATGSLLFVAMAGLGFLLFG